LKLTIRNWKSNVLAQVIGTILLANFNVAAASQAVQIVPGGNARVEGSILSRDGDLVRIREKKSGSPVVVKITDDTKIERKKSKAPFFRHVDMDVTAMVPGLKIEAEGVGNSHGQLDAKKISFTPNEFAIEVAEEQQVQACQVAAQNAQSTANRGVVAAHLAQQSASQGSQQAQAAGALGVVDATAVAMVNQRVSDLDHYKVEAENDVFFDADSAVLKDEAKPALADLAKTTKSLDGYMIEISGYAANNQNKRIDCQKLSEERAASVARYFYEVQNIPMRRILMPIGYSTTHRPASNTDPEGRELNRRVDVKVLVNKGEGEGL